MNRLTKIVDGAVSTDRDAFSAIRKLALYEDTDLTPSEVKQMKAEIEYYHKAETDGRLVKLSCRAGDTVYVKGKPVKVSFIHIEEKPTYCIQIDCAKASCSSCPFDSCYKDCNSYYEFSDDDIGKTVFLTDEEAEAQKI